MPLPYPGCFGSNAPTITVVADSCGYQDDEPNACKVGATTSDGRRDGSGLVGDPVDLTNGALSIDPLDVDLGHGLRFARHYASNGTLTTPIGNKWSHSLDWKLIRNTVSGKTIAIVREPLKAPVPFALSGST
jgi:hypothetical protein